MINFDAFYKITYGLYVVSSCFENQSSGYICNAVMQVTSKPIQLAIACNKENYTSELMQKSQKVAIAALDHQVSPTLISTFGYHSGRDTDKFANFDHFRTANNMPILKNNVTAWFEGHIINQIDLGTHLLFFVIIDDAQSTDNQVKELTYAYYREVFKGKSPKTAPTYIHLENDTQTEIQNSQKSGDIWVCEICGYEYDPAKGDPDSGIAPGTPFEALPDNWRCPLCGATKQNFTKKTSA